MIAEFTGEYGFLSNFYSCPVPLDEWIWPSAEHAFQGSKSLIPSIRGAMATLPTARHAKGHGRLIALRPDWEAVKRPVMLRAVLSKFEHDHDLAAALAATGDHVLVEGNTWGDTEWGAVPLLPGALPPRPCPYWYDADYDRAYSGHNWLGQILMMVRTLIAPEFEGAGFGFPPARQQEA